MELKRKCNILNCQLKIVLIVPLWNWNIVEPYGYNIVDGSINCTVVELKQKQSVQKDKEIMY